MTPQDNQETLKRYQEAAKEMNAVQGEYKKEFVVFCEKISFYSAGILSISTTTVIGGFSSASSKIKLATEFILFPLYYFLLLSWFFLFVSLILGLLARRQNAMHLFRAVELEFRDSLRELNKSRGHEINEIVTKNFVKAKKEERKFFKDFKFMQSSIPIAFILGVILIIIFAAGCVYQLIC